MSALPPRIERRVRTILDREARRLLREKEEAKRREENPTASEWMQDTSAWMVDEFIRRRDEESA